MGNTNSVPFKEDVDDATRKDFSIQEVVRRFVNELEKDEIYYLSVGSCALVVNAVTNMIYPKMIGAMIDSAGAGQDDLGCPQYTLPFPVWNINPHLSISGGVFPTSLFQKLSFSSLPLYITGSIASWIRVSHINNAIYLIQKRCRQKMFKKLISQGVPFFHTTAANYLLSRLLVDCEEGPKVMINSYSQFLRSCNSTIGGALQLFCISPSLTFITMLCIPVMGICLVKYSSIVKKASLQKKEMIDSVNGKAEELLNSIENVKNFGQEDYEIQRFSGGLDSCDLLAYRVNNSDGILVGAILAGFNFCSLVMLYFGAKQLRSGTISVGKLASFVLYGVLLGLGATGFSKIYTETTKASISMKRVYDIHDLPEAKENEDVLKHLNGEIELRDVSFRYASRPDVPVLENINLKFDLGKLVAIVGPSGAGKSTLSKLLTTLYQPTSGTIYLDGVDMQSLSSKWIRQKVFAVVPQEPTLFSMSIKENIMYGNEQVSFERVQEVSKLCNINNFIDTLPLAYDTQVGVNGVMLSSGQKQRIALARAILKDTPLLILDEPTSALDGFSEELISTTIDLAKHGRTVLIVTHKVDIAKRADKVVVLNGKVEFYGTLPQAVERSETFRRIFTNI
ncbi:ABC transporter, ATP-binding protein family member protein [Theileria equi strain WA]|uniref:ABC transporter, ATP-binding protein family member protein n=1 Tax=Theileria equi strain WA TaxID=1537102 RepID=L0AXR2_THEEQ|nr:ABC transporter, ATP-binding protein family member protein [Theileria equi strain WA]AFZ80350.1 ABC transporter, ATP-binding protein family member protein [Theileria equi strain WA]|eukprot:XP_004830016.1 ABC transporter, ATP-binding protein family member protein [Theileria equi strain WA]